MWKKGLAGIVSTLLVATLFVQPSLGKEYPTRPIELIAPFAAGSTMDLLARMIADVAPKYLKEPMAVVNKAGAAGSLGAAEVIRSAPDGYKLITLPSGFFSTTVKSQKVPFDPNDLIPIANFIRYKDGLVVKGDSPWKTLGDLLDYGKKNPGKLRWGHTARGTTVYISTVCIFRKAGIEAIDLPYPGGAQIVSAILGGHVDAGIGAYGAYRSHVKAGSAKYLVTYTDQRFDDPPGIPTAVELGFPEAAKLPTLVGVYGHKNTPEEVIKTLFAAFRKTYDDPEFKKGLEKLGEEPKFGGPEMIREAIKSSDEVGLPILKELGMYVGK